MTTLAQPKKAAVNLMANVARIEQARVNAAILPGDMLSDLNDAFYFYEKNQGLGVISVEHFFNILHNFGFHKANKKEKDLAIAKAYSGDFSKVTGVDFSFVRYVVAQRWNKENGAQEEALECFKLFNKRNHETITANEVKSTLVDFLEFNVTEQDI